MARKTNKRSTLGRTPRDVENAILDAQPKLEPPPHGKDQHVKLYPRSITTEPTLFQPRSFATNNALDAKYVNDLTKRIRIKGEIDPIVVIKLAKKWVCVDGHHRLAAYLKAPHYDQINCIWMAGDVQAAVNRSVADNEKIKLSLAKGERFEAAWRDTVLENGSKQEVVERNYVSDGMVARMRRMVTDYKRNTPKGKLFREELRNKTLEDTTWSEANVAWLNLPQHEKDLQAEAAALARTLRNRLQGRLSKNPTVTAKALCIYDEDLARALIDALRGALKQQEDEETEDTEDHAETETPVGPAGP